VQWRDLQKVRTPKDSSQKESPKMEEKKQPSSKSDAKQPTAAEDEWQTTGNEWIGKGICRQFTISGASSQDIGEGKSSSAKRKREAKDAVPLVSTSSGRVVAWMPPGEDKEDFALWHVVHDDGDEEDLEEEEVEQAIALYKQLTPKGAAGKGKNKHKNGTGSKSEAKKGKGSQKSKSPAKAPPKKKENNNGAGAKAEPKQSKETSKKHGGNKPAKAELKGKKAGKGAAEPMPDSSISTSGTEAGAAAAAEADDIIWQTSGHAFIGRRVARRFGEGLSFGYVNKWVPQDGVDMALWHMLHDDGDEEDLEEWEVTESLKLYAQSTGGGVASISLD
jgi:hypothetical protein